MQNQDNIISTLGTITFKDCVGDGTGFGVRNFGTISTGGQLQTCGLSLTGTNNGGTVPVGGSYNIQNESVATISYGSWVDCT